MPTQLFVCRRRSYTKTGKGNVNYTALPLNSTPSQVLTLLIRIASHIFTRRDEVISKTKYLEEEAKNNADLEDTDELQIQDESESEDDSKADDDVFYDSDDNDLDEE